MTSEQERLARQWADRVMTTTLERIDPVQRAAAQYILATIPAPTMADVEWDDKKHYLAGAVDVDGKEVVMLVEADETIRVCAADRMGLAYPVLEYPNTLTPNGKKYELREVGATVSSNENVAPDQPEHPKFLGTLEEYKAAPAGTIIAKDGELPLMKAATGDWQARNRSARPASLAGYRFRVLRRGWGDEA